MIYDKIINFDVECKETNLIFQDRIRTIIHLIHMIQSTDGIMKLLSFYPAFRKDKMFSQISRKINDCWQAIMKTIVHQSEEDFLNEILANLRVTQLESKNLN